MIFTNKPKLKDDGSVPGDYYDSDYWEAGAKSGKGSYNGNEYSDNVEACKIWAMDCYNRWGPFTSFLELGCGRAWNIYGFLHLPDLGLDYEHVLGVDISAYAIETAHPEVRPYVRQGDISDLSDVPDRSYDLIFSNDVLEHLTPQQVMNCLQACARITRKRIVHLVSVGDNIDLTTGQVPPDQDQSHINLKSSTWWKEMFDRVFQHAGWEIKTPIDHGRTFEFIVEMSDDTAAWRNAIADGAK